MSGTDKLTSTLYTTEGPIRGVSSNGICQWLGIPYASPPVGDFRWRPPTAVVPWTVPRLATKYGPICAQEEGAFPGFGASSLTEDCLYLNVYSPENFEPGKRLPVMVWLHGGGLFQGASNDYDPQWLVKNGNVVFVSFNYRLNLFGFFSHPAINAEKHPSGNYGIMDQQEALRWVQKNIRIFGGDPGNVTIFGESAGAISVSAHLASPGSKTLFHKAIVQSGGSPITFAHPSLEDLENTGIALVEAAGCTGHSSEELRQLTTEQLLEANSVPEGTFGTTNFPFGLMEDGSIIPKDLPQIFKDGKFARVPLMIGVTKDEFAWFQGMIELSTGKKILEDTYPSTLSQFLDTAAKIGFLGVSLPSDAFDEVLKRYPFSEHPHPGRAVAAAIGDAGIISTAGRRAARVIKRFVPDVYTYEFDVEDCPVSWPPVSFPYGSCHAQELQFLFKQFHGANGKTNSLSKDQGDLASTMVHYWTTFAAIGSPSSKDNQGSEPEWEVYDPSSDNAMLLCTPKAHMISNWGGRHHMDFWDSFYT